MNKVQTGFGIGVVHMVICWVTFELADNMGITIPVVVVSAILAATLCSVVNKKC